MCSDSLSDWINQQACHCREGRRHWWLERPLLLKFTFCGGLVAKSCLTLVTPWTIARQAPMSMGFSKQEYRSGLPFFSPGIFPSQELKLGLKHCRQILYQLSYEGSQIHLWSYINMSKFTMSFFKKPKETQFCSHVILEADTRAQRAQG